MRVQVAVKRLKHELEDLDEEAHAEFISEIRFMRGLRHKNIVYFYGAGFMHNQPFLVAEYMARGALSSLLGNKALDLSWDRRLGFLIDTAAGMNFLHCLNPPRIHRYVCLCFCVCVCLSVCVCVCVPSPSGCIFLLSHKQQSLFVDLWSSFSEI